MLRWAKISLFKLLFQSDFKWLISVHNFLLLDLHPAKFQLLVTSSSVLRKTQCYWNIFDISRTYVVNNMLIPLLVRCNFNLFKLCCILFLLWSIRFMLLFVHISFRWLFTSWALCWCLFFLVIMLEIETSQLGDFADMARPTINFAISLGSLSDGMSLVPTWKIIAPWDALT